MLGLEFLLTGSEMRKSGSRGLWQVSFINPSLLSAGLCAIPFTVPDIHTDHFTTAFAGSSQLSYLTDQESEALGG